MSQEGDKYAKLINRLNHLLGRQNELIDEIEQVKTEVVRLKRQADRPIEGHPAPSPLPDRPASPQPAATQNTPESKPPTPQAEPARTTPDSKPVATLARIAAEARAKEAEKTKKATKKPDLESWIGQNLINKVGIAILVIGVAIGVKYSIDHNLISPILRMTLGYLTGGALIATGYWLRKNYENYSAVLVGGGIATMYFVTYSGYSFFGIIPQTAAFAVMLLLTIYAVYTALSYNLEVIAHIALVGAYAVPLLLSDGSGRVAVLFTYTAIINAGILVVAYFKSWIRLSYSSLVITWLLYTSWYVSGYDAEANFTASLIFLSVTFLTFYAMFLVYKLRQKQPFMFEDLILLLGNSLLYYMVVFVQMQQYPAAEPYLGLFTLANGIIHLLVALVIYKRGVDIKLFYFAAGIGAALLAIIIPIELDGHMVTLLWSLLGAVLFAIGRRKQEGFYELMAYSLLILAFFSLIQDWELGYNFSSYNQIRYFTPIVNIWFLTSLVYALSAGTVVYLLRNYRVTGPRYFGGITSALGSILIIILIVTCYNMFRLEIAHAISLAYKQATDALPAAKYYSMYNPWIYSIVLQFIYTTGFVSILGYLNLTRIKNDRLGAVGLFLHLVLTFGYLLVILYMLGELRSDFLSTTRDIIIMPRYFPLYGRYIVMLVMGLSFLVGPTGT
ncbi:MAG: DUF2339 domain-containing protein [Cyclobacteriaceae bacterium]